MSTEIESLELKIVSNSTDAVNGIDALTQSLSKLKNATKGLGLSGVATGIGKVATATSKAASSNKNATKSFTDLYHKLKTTARGFEMVGKSIYSAIQKSSEYVENVNLFTVSMGEYADAAKTYAEEVGELMGIDPGEWMRSQGVFMTLATGFGVAGDRAAVMSKNLTQLGYDLSSFFNISYEDAMQKLQSGLSGELEPLRRIGYDLSQAKLEATALKLGIDKAVSSMTQAEKAELRYYAIMTQVTTAHGDMARTLDAPANQLKVFRSQVNMAAREIGNIFIPALNAVLPYAIAVAKVIRYLASTIASIVGFEMPEVDYSGVDAMGNASENTSSALDDATESAKKLKSYMLGFDELNVINPNEGSSSDAEDALSGFDFALPEYDFLEGLVDTKIAEIVEKMKEWLGLTDDIDSWSELFETRLGHILQLVGLIGAGMALWKVTKGTIDAVSAIKALLSNPSYAIAISVTVAIVGFTMAFMGLKDAIEDGLDEFNFAEIIGGSLLGTGAVALLGAKIATWISTAFSSSAVASALSTVATNLGVSSVGAAGAAIGGAISAVILGLSAFFVGIYDACKEGIDWLNSTLVGLGATAAGAGIGAIIGMLGGPIGAGIGALIGLAIGLITDFTIWFWQKFDEIEAWFMGLPAWGKAIAAALTAVIIGSTPVGWIVAAIVGVITLIKKWDEIPGWVNKNVVQPVVKFFKGLWDSVSGFFTNLWKDIKAVWDAVSTWFDENVIQPVVSFFEGAAQRIGEFLEGCWIIIQAVWLIASTWFNETFVIPTVALFKGLWESVSGFFTQLWEDISTAWKGACDWFNETFVTPVVALFKAIWTDVSSFFASLWEDITLKWSEACTWFNDTIITPVQSAFKAMCEAIGGFFSSLWLSIRQGVAGAMNGVIGAIESAINWVVDGINDLIGGFNDVVKWAANVIGEDWGGVTLVQKVSFSRITVPTYAEGGFPEQGQMFIAREAGAEMVGNIGRRTAVANNDQIVAGIAGGVAEANEEQNMLLREQNSLLRAILEKDSGTYLDGKRLTESVEKYQRERGRVLIAGGVL